MQSGKQTFLLAVNSAFLLDPQRMAEIKQILRSLPVRVCPANVAEP